MKKFFKTSIALSLFLITLSLIACGNNNMQYGTVTRTPDLTGGANLSYCYDEKTHTAWFGGENETVAYYNEDLSVNRTAGNRVGVTITAPKDVNNFEGFKLTIYDNKVYEGLNSSGIPNAFDGENYMYIYPLVSESQKSVTIKIKWNNEMDEQTYMVKIKDGTTFANA